MNNPKDQQEALSLSSERRAQEITSTLEALITEHLNNCSKCNPPFKPIKLGEKAGFCSDYWDMIAEWSDREGQVNNVVAHDEYGNQAPRNLPG